MVEMTRRRLLGTLGAVPALAAARPLDGRAAACVAGPLPALHPMARLAIGRFEVTFLSDGYIDLPFAVFTGPAPAAVEAAVAARFAARPTGVRAGFTVWLIRDGTRLILADTGAAGTVSPTSGRLADALAAIDLAPSQIDAVIITHAHADHVGGLVAGGHAAFGGAEVMINRADLTHFTDPARRSAATDLQRTGFDATAEVVRLYPALQAFDLAPGGSRQVVPGVELVDLAGHTPGHTGIRIADAGRSLLLAGDMLFHPAAHPVMAGIGIAFEEDKAAADAARAAFFARAAEEQALVAATHMPFPGLGRIVADGPGLAWMPADWEYAP